ncbi:MAG: SAM-dependent methyltransferase [Candidatus Magasanikbacteria bacterium GW2011_GWA2_37_8]|uniref:SAM-dependent methyltransferase n=1 Tax=Candidatus Magasanikbacteria bacterium GW2011_GWA2_37_8 TaxID=1619036 RepID=A0A0G0KGG4_9BACT|nr:MAG: SAM-dependent methyltransferase [Candidatus Magasanikbacteria bacterium GW2011_GWA2_37_8]
MENIELKFLDKVFKLTLRDEADVSVMREIFKLREYRLAEETIKSAKDPIIDVGAHAGFFSLYASAFNSNVKIFALEPEPKNFDILEKHLKNNKIKNVLPLAVALSSKSGKQKLHLSKDSHNHYLSSGEAVEETIMVPTQDLTNFCEKNKIKNISLLKLDIEGGEYDIFRSLSTENYDIIKSVVMEYHNYDKNNHTEIVQLLREHGFTVQTFPSKFDKKLGFIFARNKRNNN